MSRAKTLSKTNILIAVGYLVLAIFFVMNFFTMSDKYQKEELKYIIDAEVRIKEILDRDDRKMALELTQLVDEMSIEIAVSSKGEPVFSSLPYQDNMVGVLNDNAILMESQGNYGKYDVWYALYHMPDIYFFQPFFIQQGIVLTIIILLLFFLIRNMRKAMRDPLQTIKESISKIQEYDFSSISSGEDVINEEFNRFSEDLNSNLQNVSRRYSELEIALQIERERLNNTMVVSKSFIHDMKSPIHQNLMANEMYIKDLVDPDIQTVQLSELNIKQSEVLLNTINDVLKLMKHDAFADSEVNETFDVIAMFMNSLKSFKTLFRKHSLELDLELEETLIATMNKSSFFLLIHNLLSNMGHYAPEKSVVNIRIAQEDASVLLEFSNESTAANIERMRKTEQIFNHVEGGNKFSGGNGLFLIKDLSRILNGSYELIASDGRVCIQIRLPLGDQHEDH